MLKKQDNILCPFCCYRFHPNEAEFRLQPSISIDVKKSKKTTDGKLLDEKLYNYHATISQSTDKIAKEKAMQYPFAAVDNDGITYDNLDIETHGFVQRVTFTNTDGHLEVSDIRLCPNCHNNLPIGYGMRDTVLISILGDARSGKSVFLTMLIAELENNSDFVSKLTFIGDKEVRENFYETYQKPLLKEQTLISSTKRKKIPPYAFNYWYNYKDENGTLRENSIDVIFYDIAGEDLRDDYGIRNNGFNIKDSSGLIFLVDPTNFRRMADLFRFSDAALIDAIPDENSNQAIFNTLYNYFIGLNMEKSEIPMALTLSKADLFKYVNFSFFGNKPENRIQNMVNDEIHRGAVNMPSIKGINQEVRELISHLGEDGVLNNAAGSFKNVNCFAISSLGKKPTVEKISDPKTNETVEKGFIDGPLIPFRVKEPFYWILMRNKLMLKYENGRYVLHSDTHTNAEVVDKVSVWQRILNFINSFKK